MPDRNRDIAVVRTVALKGWRGLPRQLRDADPNKGLLHRAVRLIVGDDDELLRVVEGMGVRPDGAPKADRKLLNEMNLKYLSTPLLVREKGRETNMWLDSLTSEHDEGGELSGTEYLLWTIAAAAVVGIAVYVLRQQRGAKSQKNPEPVRLTLLVVIGRNRLRELGTREGAEGAQDLLDAANKWRCLRSPEADALESKLTVEDDGDSKLDLLLVAVDFSMRAAEGVPQFKPELSRRLPSGSGFRWRTVGRVPKANALKDAGFS